MPTLVHRRAAQAVPQTWIVHREMALLLGWPRAILLQFAHPLVAQGVADHSRFATDTRGRWQRLSRTVGAMLTLTFGAETEARAVADRINGIHDRVSGHLPGVAGNFVRGTPYSARDPELLRWVHATCVQSFMLAYERFVRPLTPAERDTYCDESADGARCFGIPGAWVPRTAAALDAYVAGMIADGPIVVTGTARRLASEVVAPASPLAMRPVYAVLRFATAGLLPPAVRDAYGFRWNARRDRALQTAAAVSRTVVPRLPAAVRCWPLARAAFARRSRSTPA